MFGNYINYVDSVLDFTTVNREVISNNISNFNTPEFKTKSLSFDKVMEDNMRLEIKNTDERHINNKIGVMEVPKYSESQESTGSKRIDGNNVDQTAEMIKMLKNNYITSTAVNATNKEFNLFRTAIGR
jgi:flagellar basal-body rod protein FlgB